MRVLEHHKSIISSFVLSFLEKHALMNKEVIKQGVTLSDVWNALFKNPLILSSVSINISNPNEGEGVLQAGCCFIQLCKVDKEKDDLSYEVILCDYSDSNKQIYILSAPAFDSKLVEIDISEMKENVTIDLNREGRRWEGGELNGKPFGFGREYSEEGNLVYEGFVFEGKKVCIGKEWNDDGNNNCLVYEGCYCNGERCGKGKSYDLNGKVDYEGEWINNKPNNHSIVINKDLFIPMTIDNLYIGHKPGSTESNNGNIPIRSNTNGIALRDMGMYSIAMANQYGMGGFGFCTKDFTVERDCFSRLPIKSICISSLFPELQEITISSGCFQRVHQFIIDDLPSLLRLDIGNGCFSNNDKTDDSICRITNCPNLLELMLRDWSFENFKVFELSKVDSLRTLLLGKFCFENSNLTLKGKINDRILQ